MIGKAMGAVVAIAAMMLAGAAGAQEYPTRPVKIVVGFAPGSGTDILARIVAEELRTALKQPFIVENRPGANAQIAAQFVAEAAPDGYTLLLTSNSSHSINPHVYRRLPYDPIKDFTPIGRICDFPLVLVVDPRLPVTTPAELVAYVRANPGKISYAYPSRPGQVAGAALNEAMHLDMNGIAYTSSPPAMQDVAAGREAFVVTDFASSQGLIKAGKLRPIAVTTAATTRLAPDLPALGPALGLEGFDLRAWTGLFGPAKLPAPITGRLSAELARILQNPALQERLTASGMEATPLEGAAFGAFVQSQLAVWGAKVKAAGIEPE